MSCILFIANSIIDRRVSKSITFLHKIKKRIKISNAHSMYHWFTITSILECALDKREYKQLNILKQCTNYKN